MGADRCSPASGLRVYFFLFLGQECLGSLQFTRLELGGILLQDPLDRL